MTATSARMQFRGHLPHVFPFLLAVSTVTLLVASNPEEGIVAENLRAPLIVAVFITAVGWAISALLYRDRLRQSLATSAIVLPLLLSGYLATWIPDRLPGGAARAGSEVGLTLILVGAGLYFVNHGQWRREVGTFLDVFSGLVLLISLPALAHVVTAPAFSELEPTVLPDSTSIDRPSIYFVLLDGYTGPRSLLEYYGFEDDSLISFLKNRDFSIPERMDSNYMRTFLSLGSMLNRDYVGEQVAAAAPGYTDRSAAYVRMEFSRTALDLKRLGYRFYYVGSSYPPLASNRLADEQFSDRPSHAFESLYFAQTIIEPGIDLCRSAGLCDPPNEIFQPESGDETNARISYLHQLIDRPGPKFVFAHWLLPHEPYRFGPDCSIRKPRWTFGDDPIVEDDTLRKLYIDQLICTNRKVEALVDAIQTRSGAVPIIILQADHGNGRFIQGLPADLSDARPDQVAERFDAFAAYYGPGTLADSMASQRSPVNVFRTVFRVLWGVDEPPLENRHYWSDREQPLLLQSVILD